MTVRLSLLAGLICMIAVLPVSAAKSPAAFRIAGYLPEYRAAEFDLASARSLTDLIVFSAEPTAAGGLDVSRLKNLPWGRLRTFKTLERVRLILCGGGWERSTHFATVALSASRRRAFAQSVVQFCRDERFDGVDLDWEHPRGEADEAAYGKLLADLL